MSYGPPLDVFGEDPDDDERDGLSPWADASRRRWEHTFWLERLETARPLAPACSKRQHPEICVEHPADGERLSTQGRAWEAKRLRVLGLIDVPWDPADAGPLCNDDAPPPPSGVRLRWRPTPVSAGEPRPPRKRPTLTLV